MSFYFGTLTFFGKTFYLATMNHTKVLKILIRKNTIIILRGDKDSSVVIMNRSNYLVNLEEMTEEGVNPIEDRPS